MYQTSWRDRLAVRLINFILLRVATRQYCKFFASSIQYGIDARARDLAEGREEPKNWQTYSTKGTS